LSALPDLYCVPYQQLERLRIRIDAELDEARSLASAGGELYEAVEVLAVAELVAAGYHRHKGEWRMRRRA
jgi:hypothetical protein